MKHLKEEDGLDEAIKSEENPEATETDNGKYGQITCPRCGSTHIAFVTEYHKANLAKLFLVILLSVMAILISVAAANKFADGTGAGCTIVAAILGVISLGLLFHIFFEESKTHVQAICRNCGKLWLLN